MHETVGRKDLRIPAVIAIFFIVQFFSLNSLAARPFKMAATAVQMVPLTAQTYRNGTQQNSLASVAANVDVITLWPEYLGIPYEEFAAGPSIAADHPWTVKMQQLRAEVEATGKPVMLELGFVRTGMAPKASNVGGQLVVDTSWAPVCYDFTQVGAQTIGEAYVNYAVWMAETFNPEYLVNFIEANLYYQDCGGATASWNTLVAIQHAAYHAIKSSRPALKVFPSIHIETLYDHQLDGWNAEQFTAISALARDLIGISSYPFGLQVSEGQFATPYDLPADYLVRIMLRHPQERLAIAETGWNNSSISIGDTDFCIENFPYSEPGFVRDYLSFVFASAHFGQFEIVNWWSMSDSMEASALSSCYVRDSQPYAACNGNPWCMTVNYIKDVTFEGGSELFSELVQKAFGSMGLREYSGSERPGVMQVWRNELENVN